MSEGFQSYKGFRLLQEEHREDKEIQRKLLQREFKGGINNDYIKEETD